MRAKANMPLISRQSKQIHGPVLKGSILVPTFSFGGACLGSKSIGFLHFLLKQ